MSACQAARGMCAHHSLQWVYHQKDSDDHIPDEQSNQRVPADLNHETPGGIEEVPLLISTEKVRDIVLLRIDAAGGRAF